MRVIAKETGESRTGMRKDRKQITKIFLMNKISATLIIPIEIARRNGLDHPRHITVEEVPEGGILIRKLDID
jgi:hypothetical protein